MDPIVPLDHARGLLSRHFGFADFRPAQARVIHSVLSGRDVLAVLPTGGGKSVCFQVPALATEGLCLVVSPLISLMQDQVAGARSRGITAAALHSALPEADARAAVDASARGELRLLYTSPERLPRVATALMERRARIALLAVDEAHCISEWGHDFRPEFRAIGAVRAALGRPPAIALTGSATPAVRQDIIDVLGLGSVDRAARIHLASFDRPNLWFGARAVRDERERARALFQLVVRGETAIVYAPTRKSTETLALALRHAGHLAAPYHAGLDDQTRSAVLDDFLAGRIRVIAATSAFGMGIDKPDVRTVVHWAMPPTPEAYYQEAGRAGRDGAPARCVLLVRRGDAELHRRQLDVTFPDRRLLEALWNGRKDPRRVPPNVRESADRLRAELGAGPPDWAQIQKRRQGSERRIACMAQYASTGGCRRRVLVGYFGEVLRACAGCDHCTKER